ncbi:MAG: response regulator transcription factor [Candidatus Aminicenantes bacterium]|nr:response regulator transcription factor [Candidatus Aminicenantes bacterium]NLH75708.1 response regulator transcription factor [Acidobacteriota bacterium]
MNILVIEDEKKVGLALKKGLESEHYQVELALTGEDGFFLLSSGEFDLVILDLMLPGRNGTEILRTLRKTDKKTPVLILTARDALEDKIFGLDLGADDYLVKPFAFPELTARIRALLRRGRGDPRTKLGLADLEMDLIKRTVTRDRQVITLTVKEFDLLEYLLSNSGHVVTRDMLVRDVWKETLRATPLDNVIDVHIGRLRRKIDDLFAVKLIHTVRGVGFILSETAL